MCFVHYLSQSVCNVCTVASMWRQPVFRHVKFWGDCWHSPLHPRYISCSTRIFSEYCWIWLIWYNSFVAKICCGHQSHCRWVIPDLFLWLSLVKFPFLTQTSVLSHHGQLGVALAFLPPLFLVILWVLHSLMYRGLGSTRPMCYLSFHYYIYVDTAIQMWLMVSLHMSNNKS